MYTNKNSCSLTHIVWRSLHSLNQLTQTWKGNGSHGPRSRISSTNGTFHTWACSCCTLNVNLSSVLLQYLCIPIDSCKFHDASSSQEHHPRISKNTAAPWLSHLACLLVATIASGSRDFIESTQVHNWLSCVTNSMDAKQGDFVAIGFISSMETCQNQPLVASIEFWDISKTYSAVFFQCWGPSTTVVDSCPIRAHPAPTLPCYPFWQHNKAKSSVIYAKSLRVYSIHFQTLKFTGILVYWNMCPHISTSKIPRHENACCLTFCTFRQRLGGLSTGNTNPTPKLSSQHALRIFLWRFSLPEFMDLNGSAQHCGIAAFS